LGQGMENLILQRHVKRSCSRFKRVGTAKQSTGTIPNIDMQADLHSIKPGLNGSCAFPGWHPNQSCEQRDFSSHATSSFLCPYSTLMCLKTHESRSSMTESSQQRLDGPGFAARVTSPKYTFATETKIHTAWEIINVRVKKVLNQEEHMKKYWIILAMFALFNTNALAESFGVYFVGASYNTYNPGKAEGFRFGARLAGGLDVQADYILGRIDSLGGTDGFSLYYGAGAHAGLGLIYNFPEVGAHVILGIEYLLSPTMSVFLEACPGLSFYIGTGPFSGLGGYYGGALGLNLKL
jgi:hypothetical protein